MAHSKNPTRSVLGVVAQLERLTRLWLEPRLARQDITYAEFRIVGLLLGDRPVTAQSELAADLGIRSATLSVSLTELERKGLVTRVPDANDARIKRVKASGAQGQFNGVFDDIRELHEVALAGASTEDLAATQRVLALAIDNLQQASPRPTNRP